MRAWATPPAVFKDATVLASSITSHVKVNSISKENIVAVYYCCSG
jgi:hypothetical protein